MVSRPDDERYMCQRLLSFFGEEGQRKVASSNVLIAGCGALGSNCAELLTRAGIGRLFLLDYDTVELQNLQRQALITEDDVGRLKGEALADHLRRINSRIEADPKIEKMDGGNALQLLNGVDLVIDGFDNLGSRYVLNDACVRLGLPWVFGAVAGASGISMTVVPGKGPCLRCLFPEQPEEKFVLNAGNAGLVNTVVRAIAAVQVTSALRCVVESPDTSGALITWDVWAGVCDVQTVPRSPDCVCCALGEYEYLS